MRKYIPFLLLVLSACDFNVKTSTSTSSSLQSGKSIDENLRNTIQEKNQFVVECLEAENSRDISKVASKYMLDEGFIEGTPILDSYGKLMETNEFSVFGEYYAKASEPKVEIKIDEKFNRGGDTNKFEIRYRSMAEESYLSLLVKNTGSSELLITALYGYYDEEWKLDFLSLSTLTSYGMTAPEFYYASQEFRQEGDIVNAYIYSLFAELTIEPCEGLFFYDKRQEMIDYSNSVKMDYESKISLPDTMHNIKSHPIIIGLGVKISANLDYLPWIQYFTSLDPSDTEAISAERNEIAKEIESVFPGLSRKFKTQMYEAYVQQ
ncbi:hypothetical protein K6119_00560 [Paracrocinitomix mangrovi]|uniref:hypothetical protein n=1 Tax=Paracrocinitomix mangrovi TaxID=2862509 RepID=UPI001C8E8BEE|nr:hypothetical protein [Paracrocinitomix mangrovi]UKN02006.1 hypothetical protein K6119_00560 [Paracrocinitomix mangrovi]